MHASLGMGILLTGLLLAGCRGRLEEQDSSALTVGGACRPVGHAAIPGSHGAALAVKIKVGRFTSDYRLECLNIQGTNATIYKVAGSGEPRHVFKLPHNTELARENYNFEYQLFENFKKSAQNRSKILAGYLVETDPATFYLPSGELQGFRKRYINGSTLAQLGRLDPKNPGQQKIIQKVQQLYEALKSTVAEGYNIDDINDHNVMWSPTEDRLWIIDGHLEQGVAADFNKMGAFEERCLHDWAWCREARRRSSGAAEVY